VTSLPHPIPFLSPATRDELDQVAQEATGAESFALLAERCLLSDTEAIASGGERGWRPSGADTLALRIALEVAVFLRDVTTAVRLQETGRALLAASADDERAAFERIRAKLGLASKGWTPTYVAEQRAGQDWAKEYLEDHADESPAVFFRHRYAVQKGDLEHVPTYLAFLDALDEAKK
jgi:hypothetical protein